MCSEVKPCYCVCEYENSEICTVDAAYLLTYNIAIYVLETFKFSEILA